MVVNRQKCSVGTSFRYYRNYMGPEIISQMMQLFKYYYEVDKYTPV